MNFFATNQYEDTDSEAEYDELTRRREVKVQQRLKPDDDPEAEIEATPNANEADANSPKVSEFGGEMTVVRFSSVLSVDDEQKINQMYEARKKGDSEAHGHGDSPEFGQSETKFSRISEYKTMIEGGDQLTETNLALLDEIGKSKLPPVKKGFLHKRSSHLCGIFSKARFFCLEDCKLKWYDVNEEITDPTYYNLETPLGVIDFMLIEMCVSKLPNSKTRESSWLCCPWNEYEFRLQPKISSRAFDLTLDGPDGSEKNLQSWVDAIQTTIHITEHLFKDFKVDDSMIPRRWWKQTIILAPQFAQIAQTGDLLLFRTNSNVAKLQRLVTRGSFDHVGVLIRFQNNSRLCILEAMGETGVSLVEWDSFIKNSWNKLYTRTAYRRLEFDRDPERLQPFLVWMRSVYGRPYKLSFDGIKKGMEKKSRKSVVLPNNDQDRGFFCSELVAKAYKVLKLLPEERASVQYWPSVFADHNPSSAQKLEWTSDVKSVSGEMDILFVEKI